MWLQDTEDFEKFRTGIAGRLGYHTADHAIQMLRIFIIIFGIPITMYTDTWGDHLAMLLKIKHWPGWNFPNGYSVCSVLVGVETE